MKRCFEGRVTDTEGSIFTAELTCLTDDDAPTVYADFQQEVIEGGPVEPGDIIDVIKVAGKMHVRRMDLEPWTREDLNRIWEKARRRAEAFEKWTD